MVGIGIGWIEMIEPDHAMISVLIGLVSTEDRRRILETLESLASKQGVTACEVILVDRRRDEVSVEISRRYPKVRLISCPDGTTLPVPDGVVDIDATGRVATLTTRRYAPDLHEIYRRAGAVVQEVQRMTLEEIFVANVMASRKERTK